jgi:hypothetical protein
MSVGSPDQQSTRYCGSMSRWGLYDAKERKKTPVFEVDAVAPPSQLPNDAGPERRHPIRIQIAEIERRRDWRTWGLHNIHNLGPGCVLVGGGVTLHPRTRRNSLRCR